MSEFGDKEISRVLVLIAMEAEARPLLDHLQLKQVDVKIPFAPFLVYTGDYKGKTLTVVTNGKCGRFNVDNVGTTPGKEAILITHGTRYHTCSAELVLCLCSHILQLRCRRSTQSTRPALT